MYAIIDADGWYGNTTTVYEVHTVRWDAQRATQGRRSMQIIVGGAFSVGQKIHSSNIGTVYPRMLP